MSHAIPARSTFTLAHIDNVPYLYHYFGVNSVAKSSRSIVEAIDVVRRALTPVAAIKLYRELHPGMGLAEAKDFVDYLRDVADGRRARYVADNDADDFTARATTPRDRTPFIEVPKGAGY